MKATGTEAMYLSLGVEDVECPAASLAGFGGEVGGEVGVVSLVLRSTTRMKVFF